MTEKMFDVTVERQQRLTMTVGVLAESPKDAEAKVMVMEKIHRDAGWTRHPATKPGLATAVVRQGEEIFTRKSVRFPTGRPSGRWAPPVA